MTGIQAAITFWAGAFFGAGLAALFFGLGTWRSRRRWERLVDEWQSYAYDLERRAGVVQP